MGARRRQGLQPQAQSPAAQRCRDRPPRASQRRGSGMIHTLKIRELNDAFRRLKSGGGKLLLTPGISALPQADQIAVLAKVASFDDFSEDNDPHGEHDFGAFDHVGDRIFWKIDYYGLT